MPPPAEYLSRNSARYMHWTSSSEGEEGRGPVSELSEAPAPLGGRRASRPEPGSGRNATGVGADGSDPERPGYRVCPVSAFAVGWDAVSGSKGAYHD